MVKEPLQLPQWMYQAIYDEYALALKEMLAEDGPRISFSWWADQVSVTVWMGDEEICRAQTTLSNLCDEPATHWHNGKTINAEHHKYVSDIADRLQEQADRLRAVLAGLEVRE